MPSSSSPAISSGFSAVSPRSSKVRTSDGGKRAKISCCPAGVWYPAHRRAELVGYQQHDAHELLGYVLDILHEDCNRVLEKKYVENVEAAGQEIVRSGGSRAATLGRPVLGPEQTDE